MDKGRAHSPMVEHVVCNDEIRVRFPMGPFTIKIKKYKNKIKEFTNHIQNKI